jgi:hypothetical protein
MIPKAGFLVVPFLLIGLSGNGQKVKYKDLFIWLNAKEYTKAEPFLKRYLKENKGSEIPNSFLYMGLIFYDKSYKNNVLKESLLLQTNIDTALIFLDKARVAITEKEVKRNDDYYEMYRRRDLRTAESGIKLSDIQFDIEKKMKELKERKERIILLNEYFTLANKLYLKENEGYRKIQAAYPGMQEFYLQADEKSITSLKGIVEESDSCSRAFSNYKSTSSLLGRTGFNQVMDVIEIKDLKRDGGSVPDFYDDDLKVWDYRKWAASSEEIFEKEIFPLREGLIKCDIDINKLQTKLKKDSVLEESELTAILQRPLLSNLKKYDPDPLPVAVFKMKVAEIEYSAELMRNHKLKDSLNVNMRLHAVRQELKKASALDSLAGLLSKRDLSNDALNYNYYITTIYGTQEVLTSLIRTTHDFGYREKMKKKSEEERRLISLKWLVNAKDSIPLFTEPVIRRIKFKPLLIIADDHTTGIKYADSLATGYFFSITPTRVPEIKALFPLPLTVFNKRNLPIIKAMTTRDEKGQVYFAMLYSEAKTKERFTAVIAKIYRTDGLAWSKTYPLEMLPSTMSYSSETGELSIKITSPAGDNKIVVIDKTGKQIQ